MDPSLRTWVDRGVAVLSVVAIALVALDFVLLRGVRVSRIPPATAVDLIAGSYFLLLGAVLILSCLLAVVAYRLRALSNRVGELESRPDR